MRSYSPIPYDKNGSECHNFGIIDGCKFHCPVFLDGNCTLYKDKDFTEVDGMLDNWLSNGQIEITEYLEYKCYVYPNQVKELPSPRFPIMTQQDIAKSQKILEAAEVMSLAAIKFRKAKEQLSGLKFDVMFYARLFDRIRQDYT